MKPSDVCLFATWTSMGFTGLHIIITGYYVCVSMELMLNVLCRSNPLGARGNIAQRYGELVKDLWSATARSIAPLKLRVNTNCLSHPSGPLHCADTWLLCQYGGITGSTSRRK